MCNEAIYENPAVLFLVPDHFKTEGMCNEALEVDPWSLKDMPDNLKTQYMCNKAVEDDSSSLQYVPIWFVTQEQIELWFDDDYWYHDDEFFEWYKGYKKRKAQKPQ